MDPRRAGKAAFASSPERLEKLLTTHPNHTGLNHYMVHVVDAQPVAARATAAADRLGKLAPASPHLVHMPSHIYVNIRRSPMRRVNEDAVVADLSLMDRQKEQGFKVSKDWRGHNLHFLWFAAVMNEAEDAALAAASKMQEQLGNADTTHGEYVRSLGLVTLVRMERWQRVLQSPAPKGDKGLAKTYYHYARGLAQSRLGRPDEAQSSMRALQTSASMARTAAASNSAGDRNVRAMVDMAESGLQAELALSRRSFDEALSHQAKMVEAAANPDAREPPMFADGTQLALGYMQGRAGRWKDAEATYRQALAEHPASGWALRGIVQALEAQGRRAEAADVRRELERSWSTASPHLRAG